MTEVAARRRTVRIIGLAGACALVVAALTGCLKLDADLAINADATASGTLAIEFQKEAAGFLGISDLAAFEEAFKGEELGTQGLDQFTDCTTSETDAAYVYTCTFENEAFDGTSGTDGPWTITKEGNLIVLRVVNAAQEGTADDSQNLLGDANLGSIAITATFPGPITAVSGDAVEQTSDTTATISGSLTESIDASVTSESSGGGLSASIILVLVAAVAILALIVVVAVVLIMRRRKGADHEAAPAGDEAPTADPTADPTAAATIAGSAVAGAEAGEPASTEVIETVTEPVVEPVTEVVEPVTEAAPDTTPDAETPSTEDPPSA